MRILPFPTPRSRLLFLTPALLFTTALFPRFTVTRSSDFDLSRPNTEIHVHIDFYDNIRQVPRFFSNTGQKDEDCVSLDGLPCHTTQSSDEKFVGAFAIVRFQIKMRTPGASVPQLRERVRTLDHDVQMQEAAPVDKAISLLNGIGSDIQLFGSTEERFVTRRPPLSSGADSLWALIRQELFLDSDSEPFVILHWRHTLDQITLVDLIPVGKTKPISWIRCSHKANYAA